MQFIAYIDKNVSDEVGSKLKPYFQKAAKLSSTNEEEAYLLSLILKAAVRQGMISEKVENEIESLAKKHPAGPYYLLKYKPQWENLYELAFFVAIFGIIGICVGFYVGIEQPDGEYDLFPYGFESGAGYALILGFVMFVGGISKLRQELNRNKILKENETKYT